MQVASMEQLAFWAAAFWEAEQWITGKLSRLSIEGLALVEQATLAAVFLRLSLATVKHTLEYFTYTMEFVCHPGGDALEFYAARSLCHIDEMLRQQAAQETPPWPVLALESVQMLQRHMQDFALLACCRGILPEMLMAKRGIPPVLKIRLVAAFGHAAIHHDRGWLWSRLGNSKYHLFDEGAAPEQQSRWQGSRGARRRPWRYRAAAEDEAEEMGEPMYLHHLPEGVLEDRTVVAEHMETRHTHEASAQDSSPGAWSPSESPSVRIHMSL